MLCRSVVDDYEFKNYFSRNIQYYYISHFLPENIYDYSHPIFLLYKPENLIGIDLFIAEEEFLKRGFSSKALQDFIKKYIKHRVPYALSNPIKETRLIKDSLAYMLLSGRTANANGN